MMRAFQNTLWFLVPSGILFLGMFVVGGMSTGVFIRAYYLFLLPNIPFFVASYVSFSLFQKNHDPFISILVSNCVLICTWALLFYLSTLFLQLGDINFGIFLLLAIAISAWIIFFLRSLSVKYIMESLLGGDAKPNRLDKSVEFVLVLFLSAALLLGFLLFF